MVLYEDFSIKIEPKRGDTYPVIVLRSPAGEGRSQFRLPFDPATLGDLLSGLGQNVRSAQPASHEPAPATSPQAIGQQLFDALFDGPVRSLLDRSMGMIHGEGKGLRIKLHIDPEEPSLAPLGSLPWEFIYHKETRDFLNLSRFTPVLRYLDVQRPYSPLPLKPPLRILVVISDPEGFIGLDLARERKLIQDSWANQADVQVDFVEDATMLALQERLADEPWHVLHYMGHGAFDESTGRGALVLEDEHQQGVLADGSTLGILLRDAPYLRLVFLNACDTARVGRQQGLDPFAGVASAMVLAGIPAVVAMQFPISDDAAIRFSQRFYSLIARGQPVDTAVAEGRRAIRLANASSQEWGTPVLFMRAPRGEIFSVAEADAAGTRAVEAEEGLDGEMEALYSEGMQAFWAQDWARAEARFRGIADRQPDYRDVQRRLAEVERQLRLQDLDHQARDAEGRQDWRQATALLASLLAQAPERAGVKERLDAAQAALARSDRAAALYAAAREAVQQGQWDQARARLAELGSLDPAFGDPDGLHAQVTAAQAGAVQPPQGRFPTWLLGLGGLLVVAVLAIVLIVGRNPGKQADSTITPSPDSGRSIAPPADTPTATATAQRSPTPTGTLPPPAGVRFVTRQAIKAYNGPGTSFDEVGLTSSGQEMDVLGQSPGGDWLFVCCVGGEPAWVQAILGRIDGPLADVVSMAVDTPTRPPTNTPTRPSTNTPTRAAQPPTDTPTARPLPTDTPTLPPRPTNTPTPCALQVDRRLALGYDRTQLGCAITPAREIASAWQPFQTGYLWWRGDRATITLVLSDRSRREYQDSWDQVSPVPSRGLAPAGLQAPVRGFGWLWGRDDQVFQLLGWAVDEERGFCAAVQDFQRGSILTSLPSSEVSSCGGIQNRIDQIPFGPIRLVFIEGVGWRPF